MSKENKICKYTKHANKNCEFVEIYSPLSLRNTVAIQFNVGSIDDSVHGLAHMTEHLITNASSKSNQNLDFEKEGIKMNAYTYKERMIFFASSYILQPESVVKRLVQSFNWDPDEKDLLVEKNTILSEMSENSENIYKNIFNRIIESCVKYKIADKSYLHNLVGNTSTVKKIKITDVRNFIKEKLTKPLLVITSAKKLSKQQVNAIHKLLESSFDFELNNIVLDNKQNGGCSINFSIKNTQIKGFAFNSQDQKKDFVYLGLLKQYLGGDWSSIANQKMRINKQLTYFVYSGMGVFKNFSYFYIQYDVTNENKKKAQQEVNSIFSDIKEGIINEDIFIASKNMRISNVYETFKNEYDLIDDFLVSNSDFSLPTFYTLEEYLNDVRGVKIEDFKNYIKNIFD